MNILKQAHDRAKTYEGDYQCCLALAMKEIYREIAEMKKTLSEGVVEIVFVKDNGEVSRKYGTTRRNSFQYENKSGKKRRKKISPRITFWSLEDNGFRSFLPERLTSFQLVVC